MTTEQQGEQIKRTTDQLADAAYIALSNVARSLADGAITADELPAILVRLDHIEALVSQARELAQRMSNAASWAARSERAS